MWIKNMRCKCGSSLEIGERWCHGCNNVEKLCQYISCYSFNDGASRFCKHHKSKFRGMKGIIEFNDTVATICAKWYLNE